MPHLTQTEVSQLVCDALEGAEIAALVSGLQPEERQLIDAYVAKLVADRQVDLTELWKIDYVKRPPTMDEFVSDPYWLGDICVKSEESQGLFPTWREALTNDFNIDSRIHNTVITGSLGIGKCLAPGTPVRMHDGSIAAVETITPGQVLMGDDGTPRHVISTTSGSDEMYEIKAHRPRNGLVWRCNGAHILVLELDGKTVEVTAQEVFDNPEKYSRCRVIRVGQEHNLSSFTIERVGVGQYYGFTITGNRRFLLADGTVTHNTFISCVILLYKIAMCTMLKNPNAFLGMSKGTSIAYVVLSVTKGAVSATAWGDLLNMMAHSPYFREECKFNPNKKYSGLDIHLGKNIHLSAGSKGWHIIGRNTMGVFLDEGNWRIETNPDQRAYKLYDEVRTRIKNRFQRVSGFLPAISILASSARDESSFTETVIDDIKRNDNPAVERVYRYSVYRIKRHDLKLSPKWFRVAHGMKHAEPCILAGWVTEAGVAHPGEKLEPLPDGASVELVPSDYLDAFKRNVKTNLQSLCGVATGGSHRLFPSMAPVFRAVQLGEAGGLVNPCKLELIPISNEDSKNVWDYLDHPKFVTRRAGSFVPLVNPDAPRYFHLDLASANVAGVGVCHAAGRRLVDGLYDRQTGKMFSQYRPLITYDFILAITAGAVKPISLEKVQDFIFWLRDRCGFRFACGSADTWQSVQMLQTFESRGIKCKVLSLDRSKAPYFAWRDGILEDRVRLFTHHTLLREAEHLVDFADKIDHPQTTGDAEGSKDTTDGAAGAYYNAVTDDLSMAGTGSESHGALYPNDDATERPPPTVVIMPPDAERKRLVPRVTV